MCRGRSVCGFRSGIVSVCRGRGEGREEGREEEEMEVGGGDLYIALWFGNGNMWLQLKFSQLVNSGYLFDDCGKSSEVLHGSSRC